MNGKNHQKIWEDTLMENQQIDAETDGRLRAGISRKITKFRNLRKLYWTAAATVVIGLGISFYTPSLGDQPKDKVSHYFTSQEVSTKVMLPDGSKIVLEPHSKLIMAEDFGKKDRKIDFTGKGTFDIAKDNTKPFRINAKDFTVQVLGTKFFLDQTEGKQRVDLYEGKVKINQGDKITYLMPTESWSQHIEIRAENKVAIYNDARKFAFQDETFENIIVKLETAYNLNIDYPQEYRHSKINGSVTGSADEVISTLCYPFDLKPIKITENHIELK